MYDPLPLSLKQLGALAGCASRELSWGARHVARHVARWERAAATMPHDGLREAALSALRRKRGHVDGAALFAVLPRRRSPELLSVLVAYQVMLDYLDSAHERVPTEENGRQLHLALLDALDPERPLSDWYARYPGADDGGYLQGLVEACRAGCASLASYDAVRGQLLREARDGEVLALNHLTDPDARDAALRQWAVARFPDERSMAWYEVCSTASSTLVVHVLLALAAEPAVTTDEVAQVDEAYWWVSFVANMLDSYVDRVEDAANGDHSYVEHYPTEHVAVDRIVGGIERACRTARALPTGERHAVLCSAMIALYLSKRGVDQGTMASSTRRLVAAGGSLTRLLVPVLQLWRVAYGVRSA